MSDRPAKTYTLMAADRTFYASETPGLLGGNGKDKIYGRLDCPSARRALKTGVYQEVRVFFADEETAIAAGFRPCGSCMRDQYKVWKASQIPTN